MPAINGGFWDLDPEDRAAAMQGARDRADVDGFWDLPAEDRAAAYDRATGDFDLGGGRAGR